MIKIYTDGSCLGNPGPGGYGVFMTFKGHERMMSQGFIKTTNNRMELRAVIAGLDSIKTHGHPIEIVTDSKYVADSINRGWLEGWVKRGVLNQKANSDLWNNYLWLSSEHNLTFTWVKGHSGHRENDICDKLASEAAHSDDRIIDLGYDG